MAVPKRKVSKQKGRQRRAANMKAEAPELVECPQCHALIIPHHLCPECGYYKGREVIAK
ncbi:MAG: 50S ribosomal protein L32 [Peptococcaceae bacterium]|nr:50S ribosomal protein L32 [Peptococcaceae bacterium]NQS75328.1 50S ribosomal protein L32 [Candidatus Syntrophopropionicum ammoniitolerans]